MVDDATLAAELHPLRQRVQELSYRLTGFELVGIDGAHRHDFATCTTTCRRQPDGTFGCRTHCP